MSLMDQLGQAVGGLLGQNSPVGGLAGLVQTFQKNGLGDIVNSWVGTGKNLPVSPQQIQQGLGGDLLSGWRPKPGSRPMPPARNSPVCYRISWTS